MNHFKNLYWIFYNIPSLLGFGFWPQDMWDLSSPIRDWTHTLCTAKQSRKHWTTREVFIIPSLKMKKLKLKVVE